MIHTGYHKWQHADSREHEYKQQICAMLDERWSPLLCPGIALSINYALFSKPKTILFPCFSLNSLKLTLKRITKKGNLSFNSVSHCTSFLCFNNSVIPSILI